MLKRAISQLRAITEARHSPNQSVTQRIGECMRLLKDLGSHSFICNHTVLERFTYLTEMANYVLPEYRFKWPQLDWWNSSEFDSYLNEFDEYKKYNDDRRFMVDQLLRITHCVHGDTAEVGCWKGAMSYLICKSNQTTDKHHHIFDSFEGLSQPLEIDGSHWHAGDMFAPEDLVHKNLSRFEGRYSTYKGWVPTRFSDLSDILFSFVHIDVDLYQPTLDSIDFFYPRLSNGALLVCDDYGFSSCPGATQAIKDYLQDKPEKMIAMASGGGFLIKGIICADDTYYDN